MRSRVAVSLWVVVAVLGSAGSAVASGGGAGSLPFPAYDPFKEGVVTADGSSRYVTIPVGDAGTLVENIALDGGKVKDFGRTSGDYTVPVIALDGTTSGVSADGETLVLSSIRDSYRQRATRFRVFDAGVLRQGATEIRLQGDFSFDALSPDGETMYLVEYTNPRDPEDYQVRSFDIASGKLDPDPILDSEEAPGEMRGLPQTRATSPDGRWEYTLYDGGGEHPFIHALDVVEGATVCIDLPMIHSKQTHGASLEMSQDRASIELTGRDGELGAIVDTETFEVSEPGDEKEPAATAPSADDAGPSVAGIAAGALLVMALAALVIRRMRN